MSRREEIRLELQAIDLRRQALFKELDELEVAYVKQKVEEDGAYFACEDFYYLNKKLLDGYKCVPATLKVPIHRNVDNGRPERSSTKLLREKSFFVYKGKTYNFSASDYYGNQTDEEILSDISGRDVAEFVYEEGHAIIRN